VAVQVFTDEDLEALRRFPLPPASGGVVAERLDRVALSVGVVESAAGTRSASTLALRQE
jgi:hypothetical protein